MQHEYRLDSKARVTTTNTPCGHKNDNNGQNSWSSSLPKVSVVALTITGLMKAVGVAALSAPAPRSPKPCVAATTGGRQSPPATSGSIHMLQGSTASFFYRWCMCEGTTRERPQPHRYRAHLSTLDFVKRASCDCKRGRYPRDNLSFVAVDVPVDLSFCLVFAAQ